MRVFCWWVTTPALADFLWWCNSQWNLTGQGLAGDGSAVPELKRAWNISWLAIGTAESLTSIKV